MERPSWWDSKIASPLTHNIKTADEALATVSPLTSARRNGLYSALAIEEYLSQIGEISKEEAKRRKNRLLEEEDIASGLSRYLPKMGMEIEYPSLLSAPPFFSDQHAADQSRSLFISMNSTLSKLNIPKNKSTGIWDRFFVLEHSPYPSQSSYIQAVILSSLIKGGFIPHFEDKISRKDLPKMIADLMDAKGISMHINFEVPKFLDTHMGRSLGSNLILEKLIGAFAVAFSSPERLEKRTVGSLYRSKFIEDYSALGRRIETVAFELRDESVYRLLMEMQYAMGGAFALLHTLIDKTGGHDKKIVGIAKETGRLIKTIENVYKKHKVSKSERNKDFYVHCAKNPELVADMRRVLTTHTVRIKKIING